MNKKLSPGKIIFLLTFICFGLILNQQVYSQTSFRLGYSGYGLIPISGGMVQNPAGEFVYAGTNASIGGVGDITRIDNAGNIIWAKSYSTGFFTQFNDIKNVSAGNGGGYIATGGSTSSGGGAVLVRVDNNGALLWAYHYQYPNGPGNASNEYANAVIEASDGGFVVGGGVDYFYDGTTTYDTTLAFGFKVNSSGVLQWNKVWKTPSTLAGAAADVNYDKGYILDVTETADGYFFVGQTPDVTQATTSNGDKPSRALIIKTDKATGALSYIRTFGSGGTKFTGINSAITLSDGNVLLGGYDDQDAIFVKIAGTGATPTVSFNRKIHEVASIIFVKPWLIRNVMQNSDGNYSCIAMRIDPLNPTAMMGTAILKINAGTGAIMIKKTYPGIGPLGASILPKGGLAVSDQGYFAVMTDSDLSAQYILSLFKTDVNGDAGTTPASCVAAVPNPTSASYTVSYSTPTLTEYTSMTGSVIAPAVANITPVQEIFCLTVPCVPPAAATTVTATPNPICAGQTTVITASGPASGVTYNVYAAASGGSSLGSTPYTTPALTAGTTTYYIETSLNSNPSCVSTTRTIVTITVNPSPTATASSNSPVCVGSALNLSSSGGGTYSWAGPNSFSNATQNPSIASTTLAAAGTYTVTVTAAGCSATATTTVVVNASITPVTSFSYTTPVCANGTNPVPTPAGGFTAGGTYSSTAGLTINSGTGVINLATSTPGTYTVTYTISASGCTLAGNSTTTITINPTITPVTGFSYTTPVCANGTNPVPIPAGGFTGGGTYSSTAGLTINSGTGVIDLSTSAPGTYTVTYTLAASGCTLAGSNTATITINTVITPVTSFSYTTPVCLNGTNPVPIPAGGFTSGGTYSSTAGLTIDPNTGVITLSTSTAGTYTVTYTISASGCTLAGSSTTSITLSGIITPVTNFTYTTPVCANGIDPTPIPAGGFTTGGTYSSTAGLTIDPNTGVITLASSTAGTYTVTYTITASGCTLTGSSTTTITIDPVITPVTNFSYTSPVCANGTNPVPTPAGGFTTGGTYSSTAGLTIDPNTGVITLSTSTAGTYTVTYILAASGCTLTGSSTAIITIDPVITPVTSFSYTTPVCANGINPVPIPAGGFTSGGTYSSTPGLTIDPNTGVITLSTTTPGSYNVTYTFAASGCTLSGSNTATIVINSVSAPVTGFSYSTPVCSNGTNPVPVPVGGFTTGGTYSSTAGLSINASTGVITLSTSTPGSYTVTYSVPATTCGPAGSSTFTIIINLAPAITVSGTNTICQASTLSLNASGGSSYAWSGPNGFSSTLQNPSIPNVTLAATGTYSVVVTSANGCSTSGTFGVVVDPLPVITITGNTNICQGNPATLTASGLLTYSWNTGGASNSITVNPGSTTTYTVTGVDANGCANTQTATVTVSLPPVATITGSDSVCAGQGTTLTANGGSPYLWSTGATSQSITVAPGTTTIYNVIIGSGCNDTAYQTVTVNPLPVVSTSGDTTIILGTSTTLTATGGNIYTWSPSAGLSCTSCASPIATPTATTQYCVDVQTSHGCVDTACVTVFVDILCGELFVPTAFSPNNDGQNDMIYVMGNCILNLDFAIFDRWGEKVFETSDPTIGWDGTNKGKKLDDAVFVYYLKATVDGKEVNQHGNITLLK